MQRQLKAIETEIGMNRKTIGELAKFTGVSVHTIKYYEKIGLLESSRKEHSNYRSYDVRICTDIYECLKYRNMDFSLKDTGTLLREADSDMLQRMLDIRSGELEEEISRLEHMKELVDAYRAEVRALDERLGKWYIEELPDFYMKKQTVQLEYGENARIETGGINLAEDIPKSKSVVYLSREYLNGGKQEFSWGIGEFADSEIPEMEAAGISHVKKGRAFVTYMRLTGPYVSNGEMAVKVRKVFRQYGDEFPEAAYGVRVKITHDEEGNDWNYMKIFVPLE